MQNVICIAGYSLIYRRFIKNSIRNSELSNLLCLMDTYKIQNRRFISFVNHSLFHSWTNNFGAAIRFINTNPVSWTNRAENHPYLRIVILYIPMICFWMISGEYYFVVAKSLVDMVFRKRKNAIYTFMIHYSLHV